MAVSSAHIRHQLPVIKGLLQVGWSAVAGAPPAVAPPLPGPEISAELPPRSGALVNDLVRWSGGDARAWRGQLPPTMFPQWGFPLLGQTLESVPYPLTKVLNQGCRITVNAPLPAGVPLRATAQLVGIEESAHKARIHQVLRTGTAESPDALVCDVYSVVPLGKRSGGGGPRRAKPTVPRGLRELGRRRLKADAGLDFAKLTGDFNPVHWVPAYARMAGFRTVILHGFATLSIAVETVTRAHWSGDVSRFRGVDVRFTRPLVLDRRAELGVFLGEPDETGSRSLAVGTAPGGPAFMLGTLAPSPRPSFPSEPADSGAAGA
jgi:acyl dehydratase